VVSPSYFLFMLDFCHNYVEKMYLNLLIINSYVENVDFKNEL